MMPASPPAAFIKLITFETASTAMNAPAAIAATFKTFSMPPNLSTMFFTRSMPRDTPLDSVCVIRSIAGWSLFTSAWSRSNSISTRFCPSAVVSSFLVNSVSHLTPVVSHPIKIANTGSNCPPMNSFSSAMAEFS